MANNYRCGGCGRRDRNNQIGCLGSLGAYRSCPPYYTGACPDADGCYGCQNGGEALRGPNCYGLFMASQPIATAANGIIPLSRSMCSGDDFSVSCGMITARNPGTYLAIYTVRVPAGTELATTATLNVNDAIQAPGIAVIDTGTASEATTAATAQAIIDVERGDTVTLRTSEALNVTGTATQPMFTLSLVKLD